MKVKMMKTIRKLAKIILPRQDLVINLTSEKDMWERFHKHTRNDIRKAEKSGLILKEINNDVEIDRFYKLYLKEMVGFKAHEIKSIDYFVGFYLDYVRGINCYKEKKMIASVVLMWKDNYGYVAYNVSDKDFKQYRPNDLLYWEIIKWCLKNNIKQLNLGQVNIKSKNPHAIGIYKFKSKWLGEIYKQNVFHIESDKLIMNLK